MPFSGPLLGVDFLVMQHQVQRQGALERPALAVGVPGVPRLDDLAKPVCGGAGVGDVDHEDVTPGRATLPAELLLDPVATEAHEHAVRRCDEAPAMSIDECD